MSEPFSFSGFSRRTAEIANRMTRQNAGEKNQQRQRAVAELNALGAEIVVLQANLKVAQAEVGVWEAEFLPGAPEPTEARRQFLNVKISALKTLGETLEACLAAYIKLYEIRVQDAQNVLGDESAAELMEQFIQSLRDPSGGQN